MYRPMTSHSTSTLTSTSSMATSKIFFIQCDASVSADNAAHYILSTSSLELLKNKFSRDLCIGRWRHHLFLDRQNTRISTMHYQPSKFSSDRCITPMTSHYTRIQPSRLEYRNSSLLGPILCPRITSCIDILERNVRNHFSSVTMYLTDYFTLYSLNI